MTALFFLFFFFLMIRRPPRSTLFPYTSSSDLGDRAGQIVLQNFPRNCPVKIISAGLRVFRSLSDEINQDRKSTRLNSSHITISYAVFCLKKKKKNKK